MNVGVARMRLLRKKQYAFFGGLIMSMVILHTDECAVAGIDENGVMILNSDYFNEVSPEERVATLAHEILHPAFRHHKRQGFREQKLFNVACDLWINTMLQDNGIDVPEGWVTREWTYMQFGIMFPKELTQTESVETIYEKLKTASQKQQQQQGQSGGDGGVPDYPMSGDIMPGVGGAVKSELSLDGQDMSMLPKSDIEWEKVVLSADKAAQDMNNGIGTLPGSEKKRMNLEPPKVRWQDILYQFMSYATYGSKRSYKNPLRRYMSLGLLLPGEIMEKSDIAFIIDVSGSMIKVKDRIMSEVKECQRVSETRLWLLAGDTRKQFDEYIEPNDPYPDGFTGWGGTHFGWIFRTIREEANFGLSGVIIATDGFSSDPVVKGLDPGIPVAWLIYDNDHFDPPFGQVVIVDED
jgi:predicted metal-dependent peptidase